ncbi:MAG: prepilin-type N-terminal cleavage/methylation domain-containing protein [Phycisphaerae bacterium]|nr:prepilin-type N-terminal cleavage/methylation domain-containing protein [Phycisphaerae bacterium]
MTGTRPRTSSRVSGRRGLSLVETLVALVITALLLVAVTVALNASFHAYATASESASTQSSTRLIMQRLTKLVRSGRLHDAYDPDNAGVTLGPQQQPPVQTVGIQMLSTKGQLLKVYWKFNAAHGNPDLGDLWYQVGTNDPEVLLEMARCQRNTGNQPYVFTLSSVESGGGLLLHRATIDIAANPGSDATLSLESARGASDEVRLIGSAMPRKNLK